jgi:hypothetical protein
MMSKIEILKTLQDNTVAKQYTKKVKIKYLTIQKQRLNYLTNKTPPEHSNINKAIKGSLKYYNLEVSSVQM